MDFTKKNTHELYNTEYGRHVLQFPPPHGFGPCSYRSAQGWGYCRDTVRVWVTFYGVLWRDARTTRRPHNVVFFFPYILRYPVYFEVFTYMPCKAARTVAWVAVTDTR